MHFFQWGRTATKRESRKRDRLLQATSSALAQLLCGDDLSAGIGSALAILGRAVDADRVYIFENYVDPVSGVPYMSQRHEWCAMTAVAQIDNPQLQRLPYDPFIMRWYRTLAGGDAIQGLVRDFPAGERPLLEAQAIRSLLALPIQIDGRFWGFIGFDDCRRDRIWTLMEDQILRAAAAAIGNAYVRLKAEETLRANQTQYQMAVRAGQVGVWNWNLETDDIALDPQLKHMLGYRDDEIRDHLDDWGRHVHPQDRERVMAAVTEHLTGDSPEYEIEHRMLHRDGSIRWFLARGVALRSPEGKPCRVLGTDTDVTELHHSQERQRLAGVVFEAARESIVVTNAYGRIVAVNPSFTRMSGYAEAEVLGRYPRLFQSQRQARADYVALRRTLTREDTWQGEFWSRSKDGQDYLMLATISSVRDAAGRVTHHVVIATDITAQKEAERRIEHLAYYDSLTDLPNRSLLAQRAALALAMAAQRHEALAVLFLDLDHFKDVNDSLGHVEGDTLLMQAAARLRTLTRPADTLCRLGGDEFVLLLTATDQAGATLIAGQILTAFRQPFEIIGHRLGITISIGIALYPHDGSDFNALLKNADTALHRAKHNGRNNSVFYDRAMNVATFERLILEAELRQCLHSGQLRAYFQPKLRLTDGALAGAEALVRWHHPTRGLILPSNFIPVAEASDLIVELGEWMLDSVCRQLANWRRQGLPPLCVAVNLAARHFREPGFIERIAARLHDWGLPTACLELELTESTLLDTGAQTARALTAIKQLGIGLAIDDFGTGYSSLGYLKHLPLTTLKIDRSFVRDLVTDPDDRILAATIVTLGHGLGLSVVAEGVETEEQRQLLLQKGCDSAQGYLFSPAIPADEFAARFLFRPEAIAPLNCARRGM